MKNKFVIRLLLLSALTLASCQKEMPANILRGNDLGSTGLLSKVVSTYLPDHLDNVTSEYAYDSSGRLIARTNTIRIKQSGGTIAVSGGTTRFFRDNLGRAIRMGSDPDTSSVNVLIHYENEFSTRIASTCLVRTTGQGRELIDSAVFAYNTDSLVTRTDYYSRLAPSAPLQINSYEIYQYDSKGNMTRRQQFSRQANNQYTSFIAYSFEHDNKPNPAYYKDLLLVLLYSWDNMSPYNIVKQKNDYSDPVYPDDEHSYHYEYDNLGRPVSRQETTDADNITKFYYK